ncbi:MAG: EfeM/EfeO family lipoprotein [Pseudonocardiaceae bacterium]
MRLARWWWLGAAFVIGLAVTLGVFVLIRRSVTDEASAVPTLVVAENACGQGWTDRKPGAQTLILHNTDSVAADAQLIDVTTGKVLIDVEGIGSGAVVPVGVIVGGGQYALRCVFDELGAVTGPTVRIAGPAGPAGVAPVTRADLIVPVQAYQASVVAGTAPLVADVAALQTAVRSGDRAAARQTWLPAMLDYQRLGAAYGAFGDLDAAIDRTPDGLPGGVHDPHFTGLRRLEYGLWHDQPMTELVPVADALSASVTTLREQVQDLPVDGLDLTRRVHEILEDTERFELTGDSDQGSGSSLAIARAQVQATQLALKPLLPLLVTRYPALLQVDPALRRLAADLDATDHAGAWTPVQALDHAQRQQINADTGHAVELLAPIAVICEPRRTS